MKHKKEDRKQHYYKKEHVLTETELSEVWGGGGTWGGTSVTELYNSNGVMIGTICFTSGGGNEYIQWTNGRKVSFVERYNSATGVTNLMSGNQIIGSYSSTANWAPLDIPGAVGAYTNMPFERRWHQENGFEILPY